MKIGETRLSLVGAGPGDPELISLKGIKALASADVILYDALANEALLDHAPQTAIRIFVGKTAGLHHRQQKEINRMIVQYARSCGHVVRLKGGDPFVFGRGHEELEYAAAHGIPTSYIPGISSATSVPGLAGVPLTKRGINESFWVVTGTLKDHSTARDLEFAARSSATVVILMGVKKLPDIVRVFKQYRGEKEAICMISNGSKQDEQSITGDLHNIMDLRKTSGLSSPAIIVIGKVVNESRLTELIQRQAVCAQ
ncbi:uroporphyrin-III C-methyltransferase [Cyclobacterium lianum]|uniref:uroporphyrinogen-III C-methyltransferase n=1 Tax=Cyclobacterium lianum TaxID=388280 RepID=A0A1M7QJI3_9BACT|nr:uroporphyrinogen-III C-methyltransferase [Cyclobacterium lianum]SHN31410.1 uroporphyrin-III C-methyltransferase [Cyclobacterium lianum]